MAAAAVDADALRVSEAALRALIASAQAPVAEASPKESAGPAPLSSGDMAYLLGGIKRDEAGWRKMLANCPKWLIDARVSRGAPGIGAAAWNPVTVALALQSRGVPDERLRAIFANRLAAHWADAWSRAHQAGTEYGI